MEKMRETRDFGSLLRTIGKIRACVRISPQRLYGSVISGEKASLLYKQQPALD